MSFHSNIPRYIRLHFTPQLPAAPRLTLHFITLLFPPALAATNSESPPFCFLPSLSLVFSLTFSYPTARDTNVDVIAMVTGSRLVRAFVRVHERTKGAKVKDT